MTVLVVRYEVKAEKVDEVETGIGRMIAGIERDQPKGIRYVLGKLPDGVTFVGVLELAEGMENPLPGIAEAREFQQSLPGWVVGDPPTPQPVEVVGSFGLDT